MPKGKKPYSDAESRPETPEILRYLDKQHYRSPDWSSAVVKDKDRGLGTVDVPDEFAKDANQIDQLPSESKRRI